LVHCIMLLGIHPKSRPSAGGKLNIDGKLFFHDIVDFQ
jgi:hypothetical protein